MEFFLLLYYFSFSLCEVAEEIVDLLVEAFSSFDFDRSVQVFQLILGEIFDIFFLGN